METATKEQYRDLQKNNIDKLKLTPPRTNRRVYKGITKVETELDYWKRRYVE